MHRSDDESKIISSEESVSTNAPVVGDDQHSETTCRAGADGRGDSFAGDLFNVVRGFCMGAADTVPGVSGGTIALILGHYQRLITAISNIDRALVALVMQRRFAEAARHVDLRFIAALGAGIAIGIVTLAGVMHWLLDHHTSKTFAVFFGLILASVWIVKGYIDRWSPSGVIACLGGVVAAVTISMLPVASESTSLPYLFVAASVAICAMILPGISGAFVLLLFGVYHPVTGLIKEAAKGQVSIEGLTQMGAVAAGCAFGLLAFSRLLRWLLEHRRDATMAALMGLMIGSIAKLWPLQMATPETADLEMKLRVMQYVAPSAWPGSLLGLAALVAAAATIVLTIERLAGGRTAPLDH